MHIRAVRTSELPVLQAIERAAGLPFADIGMAEIAQDEPYPLPVLAASEQTGLLWVTADETDEPVAYLMASVVDDCPHIDQVSVHPDSAHRRLGRALLDHAAGHASADGLAALTMTTLAPASSASGDWRRRAAATRSRPRGASWRWHDRAHGGSGPGAAVPAGAGGWPGARLVPG